MVRQTDYLDWCCFYYFAMKWSSSYAWNSICLNLFLRFVESVFFHQFFFVFWFFLIFDFFFFFCVYVCVKSLIKSFHPSHPGPCARLSLFLLCANCTCVLVCMCLCMCMWKCVGNVISIKQVWTKPWRTSRVMLTYKIKLEIHLHSDVKQAAN